MARTLFGTDGVRGVAGEYLTAELALALARAATERLGGERPQVLVVRDTRESGEMLESAVAAGVAAAGGQALLGGVLPTPGAPLLMARRGLDLGVVISASHNPYADNGIKFFGGDGFKLSDQAEEEIEAAVAQHGAPAASSGATARVGRVGPLHGALEDYLHALEERFSGLDLSGRRVAIDCAHGATSSAGPEIFRRLGAELDVLHASPDGRNINAECGSTHLRPLIDHVRAGGHEAGFAFDGDGDRVLAVDREGTVVDGDELIALGALHRREPGVAVTVMTNFGFHTAMREAGIEVATTPVGDRHVLEALRERGWALGGEQSGHIIDMGFAPSGDGIAAALLALESLEGAELAERDAMQKLPQTLVNVSIRARGALADARGVDAAVAKESAALEGRGRVLVRPSGTEPLVRVMVEAPTAEEAEAVCGRLVAAVEREIA